VRRVLGRCARSLKNWKMLLKSEEAGRLEQWAGELEQRSARPPRIAWNSLKQETPNSRSCGAERVMNLVMNNCNRVDPHASSIISGMTPVWVTGQAVQLSAVPMRTPEDMHVNLVSDE
jgi:hypothetical protein